MAQGNGSGNVLLLLALLAGLAGVTAWNHQRNVALEQAEVRPFRTLSDADLATLLAATEAEAEKLGARYESARDLRASTDIDGTHTGERLRDFERVQSHGRQVRAMGHRVSELEASLGELRKEHQRRTGEGDSLQVFMRRAFTF